MDLQEIAKLAQVIAVLPDILSFLRFIAAGNNNHAANTTTAQILLARAGQTKTEFEQRVADSIKG